jgi:hypothetical protein
MSTEPDIYRTLVATIIGCDEAEIVPDLRRTAKHAFFKALYSVAQLPGNDRLKAAIADPDDEEIPVTVMMSKERWNRILRWSTWVAHPPVDNYLTEIINSAIDNAPKKAAEKKAAFDEVLRPEKKAATTDLESAPRYRAETSAFGGHRTIYKIAGGAKRVVLVVPDDIVIDVVEELNRALAED